MAGYAHTAGIATVASNLTGTPSIVIDNINSAIGIVTMPGQGSKMRFDFDSTLDMQLRHHGEGCLLRKQLTTSIRLLWYYHWWIPRRRRILVEDQYGNYQTSGILTASTFFGDGSGLTNLPVASNIWTQNGTGIHTMSNVGIGTTNVRRN